MVYCSRMGVVMAVGNCWYCRLCCLSISCSAVGIKKNAPVETRRQCDEQRKGLCKCVCECGQKKQETQELDSLNPIYEPSPDM